MLYLLIVTACNNIKGMVKAYIPYSEIPENYSLEDAKKDNLVIFEDRNITSGQAVWDDFIKITEQGKSNTVRLAFYYTLDDVGITPGLEEYEEIKHNYSQLFIQDLTFDGRIYTLYFVEDKKEYKFSYKYLKRFVENSPNRGTIRYILVNDKGVTWEQIVSGMLSSRFGDYIDHKIVYIKY